MTCLLRSAEHDFEAAKEAHQLALKNYNAAFEQIKTLERSLEKSCKDQESVNSKEVDDLCNQVKHIKDVGVT